MDFKKLRCNCGSCGNDAPEEETKQEEATEEETPVEGEEKTEE